MTCPRKTQVKAPPPPPCEPILTEMITKVKDVPKAIILDMQKPTGAANVCDLIKVISASLPTDELKLQGLNFKLTDPVHVQDIRSRVRVGDGYCRDFGMAVGVHQGPFLGLFLFTIMHDALSREFLRADNASCCMQMTW